MDGVVVKGGERGVVGIVILCAIVIGLISYGFADDILRFAAARLSSVDYGQMLDRITGAVTDAFIRIRTLIVSYLS